jgi:hypothetical protein
MRRRSELIDNDATTTRRHVRETERVPHPSLVVGLTHQKSQRPLVASRNTQAADRSTSTRCPKSPHTARPLWTPEDNDSFPPLTHFDDFDVALAEGITA